MTRLATSISAGPKPVTITLCPKGGRRKTAVEIPPPPVRVGEVWERDDKRRTVVDVHFKGTRSKWGTWYWAVRWSEADGRVFEGSADTFMTWVNGGAVKVERSNG